MVGPMYASFITLSYKFYCDASGNSACQTGGVWRPRTNAAMRVCRPQSGDLYGEAPDWHACCFEACPLVACLRASSKIETCTDSLPSLKSVYSSVFPLSPTVSLSGEDTINPLTQSRQPRAQPKSSLDRDSARARGPVPAPDPPRRRAHKW